MASLGGFFVCLLVIGLDIAAGMCGIEAEIAQNKVKHLRMWIFECRNPSHEAYLLGLGAAGLLLLAHIIVNVVAASMCLCSQQPHHKASSNTQLTTACLLFSCYVLLSFSSRGTPLVALSFMGMSCRRPSLPRPCP
ncbi:protein VASCULATURE COMPLEXITY AND CONNECTIVITY-like isoform X2 [Amaranthus tricolor]|uniref:protein VASCULATURE COMPLEXITY AND CONNECTIVITY-like isoform X2 n=1 Tax=Amaranthus tricolor TaxID=29722 RepID=UPI002583F9D5|nr:protein VASCULATURE COMPLEXITY AND CONNECTIVITY-like isoform X2 [Amaranthus tricolor]